MLAAPWFWPELGEQLVRYRETIIAKLRAMLGPERFGTLKQLDETFFLPQYMHEITDPANDGIDNGGLALQLDTEEHSDFTHALTNGGLRVEVYFRFSRRKLAWEEERLSLATHADIKQPGHAFPPMLSYYLRIYLQFALEMLQARPITTAIGLINGMTRPVAGHVSPEQVDTLLETEYAGLSEDRKRLFAHLFFLAFNLSLLRRQLVGHLLCDLQHRMGFTLTNLDCPRCELDALWARSIDEILPLLAIDALDEIDSDVRAMAVFDSFSYGLIPTTEVQHVFLSAYEEMTLTFLPYQSILEVSLEA